MGGIALLLAAANWLLLPLVRWLLLKLPVSKGQLPPNLMTIVICLVFALGICTYELSIFAIFGGFLAGLLFHRNKEFVEAWREQVGRFVIDRNSM